MQECTSCGLDGLIFLHYLQRDRHFRVSRSANRHRAIVAITTPSRAFSGRKIELALSERQPRHGKGRSLGERPAFLGSPPGCGVSKPWGVWEGGFDEAAWGAAGGLSEFFCIGTGQPAPNLKTNLSRAKAINTNVFNKETLPNHFAICHLQKCIPRFFSGFKFLTNFDSSRHMINKKGYSDRAKKSFLGSFYTYFQ